MRLPAPYQKPYLPLPTKKGEKRREYMYGTMKKAANAVPEKAADSQRLRRLNQIKYTLERERRQQEKDKAKTGSADETASSDELNDSRPATAGQAVTPQRLTSTALTQADSRSLLVLLMRARRQAARNHDLEGLNRLKTQEGIAAFVKKERMRAYGTAQRRHNGIDISDSNSVGRLHQASEMSTQTDRARELRSMIASEEESLEHLAEADLAYLEMVRTKAGLPHGATAGGHPGPTHPPTQRRPPGPRPRRRHPARVPDHRRRARGRSASNLGGGAGLGGLLAEADPAAAQVPEAAAPAAGHAHVRTPPPRPSSAPRPSPLGASPPVPAPTRPHLPRLYPAPERTLLAADRSSEDMQRVETELMRETTRIASCLQQQLQALSGPAAAAEAAEAGAAAAAAAAMSSAAEGNSPLQGGSPAGSSPLGSPTGEVSPTGPWKDDRGATKRSGRASAAGRGAAPRPRPASRVRGAAPNPWHYAKVSGKGGAAAKGISPAAVQAALAATPEVANAAMQRALARLYLPCTFPVPSLYLPCTFRTGG